LVGAILVGSLGFQGLEAKAQVPSTSDLESRWERVFNYFPQSIPANSSLQVFSIGVPYWYRNPARLLGEWNLLLYLTNTGKATATYVVNFNVGPGLDIRQSPPLTVFAGETKALSFYWMTGPYPTNGQQQGVDQGIITVYTNGQPGRVEWGSTFNGIMRGWPQANDTPNS
jgi:hypothetical protein